MILSHAVGCIFCVLSLFRIILGYKAALFKLDLVYYVSLIAYEP